MLPLDIFLALEWGVIALLVALEVPVTYQVSLAPVLSPVMRGIERVKEYLIPAFRKRWVQIEKVVEDFRNRRPRAA
jgi:hypothetical protein